MKLIDILMHKLLMLITGIVLLIAGQLLNCNILFYPGAFFTLFVVARLFLFAFILNPICSICKKKILKGFHRPIFSLPFCIPRFINTKYTMEKTVLFDESIFTEHTHINKLFGFAVGDIWDNPIHKNSFRFGWRIIDGKIELMSYVYINGVREYKTMTKVLPNVHYELRLYRKASEVVFKISQGRTIIAKKEYKFIHKYTYGWLAGLYYGGKKKAPHTINIKIF